LPPELVRRIVLLTTKKGNVVLDPFAGSGVVLAEAKALGRHYVGLDLRKTYLRMFEKRVLPSIVALETENHHAQLNEQRKRRAFSSLIWKLRKTKYPRELLRLYEKRYGRASVAGVIALSRKVHSLSIVFVFAANKLPPKRFLSRAERLMRRAPLSKYGLRVKVKAYTLDVNPRARARKDWLHPREALHLYQDGKTYHVSDRVTAAEFYELLRNGLGQKIRHAPPIASNIRVSVSRKAVA